MEAAVTEAVDPREGVIVKMFTQESQIFKDIPMKRIPGRYYDYARETALSGATAWRAPNTQWTSANGIHTPYREHLKIIGGAVDGDLYITTTDPNGPMDLKRRHTKLKIQELMNEFDRAVVEGSELSNPNEIAGWRSRCTASGQLIVPSTGPGALSLRLLNTALDAVKGPNSAKVIYMNPTHRLKLWDLVDTAASGSRYQITKEEGMFGEMLERYAGAKIRVMRTEGDGTSILGFDETVGGTTTCSSIYVVRYDEDDGVCGIYNHGGAGKLIMVEETKRVNGQPVDRLLFEGYYGQVVHQQRALARLAGITNA